MAGRIRTIKPEVLSDAKAARLSDAAWRLWVSSWTLADDEGRFPCDPVWLCGQVFWATPRDCAPLIIELERNGQLRRYVANGEPYAEICGWKKHQKINRPSGARYPVPVSFSEPSVSPQLRLTEGSLPPTTTTTVDLDRSAASAVPIVKSKKARAERPKWKDVVAAYSDSWAALHSLDGRKPTIDGADASALARVYDAEGIDETITLVQRFVSDTDPFISQRGHILRDLPSRVNSYRAKQAPETARRGALPKSTSVNDESRAKRKF